MGFKNLFKKGKTTASPMKASREVTTEDKIDKIYNDTGKMIQKGLSKETASTGTPMKKLNGAALFTATISNIGGGSKVTGEVVWRMDLRLSQRMEKLK